MKILLDTCACIFYVSDNVMTRVHLANIILVHIIMLLFKSHPVYRQLKKLNISQGYNQERGCLVVR